MLLLSHILIACSGLIWAAYAYMRPSQKALRTSYGLTAATIGSGTALVLLNHSYMMQACTSGLTYLAIITVATGFTWKKLASLHSD